MTYSVWCVCVCVCPLCAASAVVDSGHTLAPLVRLPKVQRASRAYVMQSSYGGASFGGAGKATPVSGHEDPTAFPDHLAVFVTHVPRDVSPEELELCFAACGEVRHCSAACVCAHHGAARAC